MENISKKKNFIPLVILKSFFQIYYKNKTLIAVNIIFIIIYILEEFQFFNITLEENILFYSSIVFILILIILVFYAIKKSFKKWEEKYFKINRNNKYFYTVIYLVFLIYSINLIYIEYDQYPTYFIKDTMYFLPFLLIWINLFIWWIVYIFWPFTKDTYVKAELYLWNTKNNNYILSYRIMLIWISILFFIYTIVPKHCDMICDGMISWLFLVISLYCVIGYTIILAILLHSSWKMFILNKILIFLEKTFYLFIILGILALPFA